MQVWCLNPYPAEISRPYHWCFSSSRFLTMKNVRILKLRLRDWVWKCVCVCMREGAGDSYRESEGLWIKSIRVYACAYCGVKISHSEFVQLVSSLLLLSLIRSMRWLDGSLHSVLGGQSSSPYQLALTPPPKTDRNTTHACVYSPAHTYTVRRSTPIPPYQTGF